MIQHISVSRVLVALGIVLLIAPALAPVQAMHFHDTGAGTTANGTELESHGVSVIAYEDLSPRGQELYVKALRNHGQYAVPLGQGAPDDFHYVTNRDSDDHAPSDRRAGTVAIERPPDADLPPADEPSYHAEEARERARERAERKQAEATPADGSATAGNETATQTAEPTPSVEERQEQLAEQRREIERYDLMNTRTGPPPLTATSNLVRLLSVVGGVLAIGVGGYLTSRP